MSRINLRVPYWTLRLAAACTLLVVASPAQAQLGGFGKIVKKAQDISNSKQAKDAKNVASSFKHMPVDLEKSIGGEVAAKMIGYFHVYNDAGLTHYVNLVGATVAAQSSRQDIQYHFAILDSNDVNAFSAPGGYVFVTRGALALCDDESELAGVLAHEVAHIAEKHVVNVIERDNKTQAFIQAGSDIVPGSEKYKEYVQEKAKQIVVKIIDQGLAPKDEFEADHDGVQFAHAAGYPADGLERFLVKLDKATNQGANSFWTRTHPPVADRNTRIQQEITSEKWQDENRPKLAERYAMAIAALKPKS